MAGLLGTSIAAAAELKLPKKQHTKPVPVKRPSPRAVDRPDETSGHTWKSPRVQWPASGDATMALSRDKQTKAGSLPVRARLAASKSKRSGSVEGPAQLQVQVLDHEATTALGVPGVVVAVRGFGGRTGLVEFELDYGSFRNAFGGGWADRLTLKQLPACAQGAKKTCGEHRVLPTGNNPKDHTLSTKLKLSPSKQRHPGSLVRSAQVSEKEPGLVPADDGVVLLAATAAPEGSSGTFKASSLAPSGKWTAGGSSGAFSWSYDIDTPDVPGELAPDLGLTYSSQSVDGRTAATNNQANWIGDGWSMEPGSIERRYTSCMDDDTGGNNTTKVGDQCWKTDNATLSLGGQSNELVKDDDEKTDTWHLKDDDGTKVVRLSSTERGNGDANGEYWRVTTPDGTRYYFGYNRLPGWSSGKAETDSTWTVPVFGNHSGEPCHASAFADSWCQQAWRWNLDYVVDPQGNAMAYYWNKETNYYGRNVSETTGNSTATQYTRGGSLDRIEYGLRSDAVYAANGAAAKVEFATDERCLSDCGTFDSAHAKNWPDVPFDQYCKSGDECKDRYSPSFWTRKRLTGIATKALVDGSYKKVDSWTLTHDFPATGDGSDRALWLDSIQRTGHTADPAITLPAVTFRGQQLANRVEGVHPEVPPLVRYRIYGIDTETGGTIGVTYSPPDCTASDLPTPSSNTSRCYPVMWSPPDSPGPDGKPYLDWFHSYVVTEVLESDNTGGAPVKQTNYSYLGGLGWVKGEDEFTKSTYRTYGDRRGYGRVQERVGAGSDKKTFTETRYFRGIDGAKVADSEGNEADDHEAFAGTEREQIVYSGDGGSIEEATATVPWRSAATATHARSGLSDLVAYMTDTKTITTRTALAGDKWQRTRTDNTFDAHGQITSSSETGDTAKSGDEQCTTTSYARNLDDNMLDLVAEAKTVAVTCDATPELPKDLVSVERSYYDSSTTLGAAPTKGNVTRTDEQDGDGTGYLTTETRTYDKYGRVLTSTDALDHTTSTSFTPAEGAAPVTTAVTNSLGHTTTTEDDPTRGIPVATIDANDKRSDAVYDALGRLTKAWEPGWTKAAHGNLPSTEYSYTLSKTEPAVVATKTLQHDASYRTSYAFYDGLLRERETQTPAIGGGRLITETRYDTRGWKTKIYNAYYAEGAASATLETAADNVVPNLTENLYDGTGRITAAISRKYGDETKRTTTTYDGDRTTVTPPDGGTVTTTIKDARDRTTEIREHITNGLSTYQSTTYGYDQHDKLATLTDPAGNTWRYTQDSRGRQIKADDPDKGITTTTYDKADRPVTVTDALGTTLTTSYDDIGRKTELKHGTTVRAKWTYDTVAKGQPTSSIRIDHGKEYATRVDNYNDRYQPTSSTVSIPAGTRGAGDYTFKYGYNTYTGDQEWTLNPALGGLSSERVTTVLSEGNLPYKTTAGSLVLVNKTSYDPFSRPQRTEFGGTLGNKLYETRNYDEHTGNLTQQITDRDTAPQRIDDITYTYDDADNITGITTASGQDAAKTTDTQCFTMDALRRLTEAWTTTQDCATDPTSSNIGGPAPYWHSYKYDVVGNRTQEVQHHFTGSATGEDITRTSTFPEAKQARPHAVRSVDTSGGASNGTSDTYSYDDAGNLITRNAAGRDQTLTWDAEQHLAEVTENGKDTNYLYDADGNRLLTRDSDGSTTLYLPAGNELKIAADGTTAGTRYYNHGDDTIAVRTKSGGLSFLFADHQGTALTAVTSAGQQITRRKQLPFGEQRTAQPSGWPGSRGFVGGTSETTGLTHLGAREYDPTLGAFISVDPLIDPTNPQQTNAYAYANNTPITASDPDGQMLKDDVTGLGYGNSKVLKNIYKKRGYINSRGQTTKKYKRLLKSYNQTWKKYYASSWYKNYVSKGKDTNYGKAKPKPAPPKPKPWYEKAWNKVKTTTSSSEFWTRTAATIGTGLVAGLVAVAACAGTAGLGCVVIAGAAVGALVGLTANLVIDKAYGHKTTGPEAVGYLASSAVRGGFQGAFRHIMGSGPGGYAAKKAWNGPVGHGIKNTWNKIRH